MKTILVVDDQSEIRRMLDLSLADDDTRVRLAKNGEEALRLVGEEVPDLLLIDYNMPVMDGVEAIRRLRRAPATRRGLRIILMSGYGQDPGRELAARAGADAFLAKPFHLHDLKSRIEQLLGRERAA